MANTASIQILASSQQFISAGNPTILSLLQSDCTIEAWVKPYNFNQAATIVSKDFNGRGGAGNREFTMFIETNRNIQFLVIGNGFNQQVPVRSTTLLNTNNWTHVTIVHQNSNHQIWIYINGQLDTTQLLGITPYGVTNAFLQIGTTDTTYSGNYSNGYTGLIDEVRLWNIQRAQSDIQTNYQRELAGNEFGLLFYWKMNNNINNSVQGSNLTSYSGGVPVFFTDVPFADTTTTSTSTSTTTTSTSTTTTSTTTTSTSTSSSTSTTTTMTSSSTSTTTTSTSTTTSTTTTLTTTSTTTSTSSSTSTTITLNLTFMVERTR